MLTLNILYIKKQLCFISPFSETHEVKGFHLEKSSGIFIHLRLETIPGYSQSPNWERQRPEFTSVLRV